MTKYMFYGLHLFMFVSLLLAWLFMLGTQMIMAELIDRHIPLTFFLKVPSFGIKFLFGGSAGELLFNLLIGPATLYMYYLTRQKKFFNCYLILWFFLSLLCYFSYYFSSSILMMLFAQGGGCGRFFTYLPLISFSMQAGIVLCLHASLFYLWKMSWNSI